MPVLPRGASKLLTLSKKSKLEIEVYDGWDGETIEERVKYHIEMAEYNNQTVEFHYSISERSTASPSNFKYSLLTIRRPKLVIK